MRSAQPTLARSIPIVTKKRTFPTTPREVHMSVEFPYVTQFCMNGGCEGVKKLNVNGTLMPSCSWRYVFDFGVTATCTHECHDVTAGLAAMAEELGKVYVPPVVEVVRTPEVAAIAANLAEIRKPEFAATESGRLAPGQLEQWLYEVVQNRMAGFVVDVSYLAFEIQLRHKGYQPSAGAIQAVLERWANMSYIKLETKPLRVAEVYEAFKMVRRTSNVLGRPRL